MILNDRNATPYAI